MKYIISFAILVTAIQASSSAFGIAIQLNSVIGPAGTNANSVKGLGNAVNETGIPSGGGATTLTFAGSPSPSSFNFNTGFGDAQDRATGGNAGIGNNNLYADRKTNSVATAPLIFDLDNDRNFADEVDAAPLDPNTFHLGIGMHADAFVTFDLDVIRANFSLAPSTEFILTGLAGVADRIDATRLTSGAIIVDGTERAVFDWDSSVANYDQIDPFTLSIAGDDRYLSFVGLSGLDASISADHIGFGDVVLTEVLQVPEPGTCTMLLGGTFAMAFGWRRSRR